MKFIRVRGRIIPIRKPGASKTPSKGKSGEVDYKKVATGALLATAGTISSLKAGTVAANMTLRAAKLENSVRNGFKVREGILAANNLVYKPGVSRLLGEVDRAVFKRVTNKIAHDYLLSNALYRAKGLVKVGAVTAGTYLGVKGLKRVYEGVTGKESGRKSAEKATVVAPAAAFLTSFGYYHLLSGGKFKDALKAALSTAKAAK